MGDGMNGGSAGVDWMDQVIWFASRPGMPIGVTLPVDSNLTRHCRASLLWPPHCSS